MPDLRIGHGFDVHRLVPGRPLIIGGVRIEHSHGLDGHSDADVLLHAIMDAILGAVGLPDIGHQFPPDDAQYKDADSSRLLSIVQEMARSAGLTEIKNIDAVIMAQQPRFGPHINRMTERISAILGLPADRIGLKATTTEGLGFVGREEGIAASAVCLVSKHE
jgi:2-C-methyl-D-erythritol 2,4-cyclodiphosphate synthase